MGYAETIAECCRYIDPEFSEGALSDRAGRRNTIIPIIISAEFFR